MKPKVYFEVFCTSPTHWYWRVRHRNKRILADGSERYQSKAKLKKSMENLIRAIVNGEWLIRDSVPEAPKAKPDKWPKQSGSSRFGKVVPGA